MALVAIWVVATHGAELGLNEQLAEAHAEIARLRTELTTAHRDCISLAEEDEVEASTPTTPPIRQTVAPVSGDVCADGSNKKDHCLGSCSMDLNVVFANCSLTTKFFELQMLYVEFDGNDTNPEWKIWSDRGRTVSAGKVSCPCNGGTGLMSKEQALASILGQVGTSLTFENNPACMGSEFDTQGVKIASATARMIRCWQSKCSSETSSNLLLDELETGFGGGSYC